MQVTKWNTEWEGVKYTEDKQGEMQIIDVVKLEIFDIRKAFIYQGLSEDPPNFPGTVLKLFITATCKIAGFPNMLQSQQIILSLNLYLPLQKHPQKYSDLTDKT